MTKTSANFPNSSVPSQSGAPRPLRVLHVCSGLNPENGGPVTAMLGLCVAQQQAGLDVRFLNSWQETSGRDNEEWLRSCGVPVTSVGPTRGRLNRHPGLRAAAEEAVAGVDVVHIHAIWEDVQHHAAVAARRAGVPYVWSPHGMLDPWGMSHNRRLKRLFLLWRLRRDLSAAAALHGASPMEAQHLRRLSFAPKQIVREPFGIDFAEFEVPTDPDFLRDRFPAIGGRKVVLMLGRLDAVKGFDLLIPAFRRVVDAAPDANPRPALVLAGPDYRDQAAVIRGLMSDAKLGEDDVFFTGMLSGPDRVAALRASTVLALPSYHENFGIVVGEALACGVPAVVSDQTMGQYLVTETGAGEVVPLRVDALAAALGRWLADDDARAAAAPRAAAYIRRELGWAESASRWIGHYRQVLQASESVTGL